LEAKKEQTLSCKRYQRQNLLNRWVV
ncbi:uncharacterized protein METZ01_LOCUS263006, partial [marine metagenome]